MIPSVDRGDADTGPVDLGLGVGLEPELELELAVDELAAAGSVGSAADLEAELRARFRSLAPGGHLRVTMSILPPALPDASEAQQLNRLLIDATSGRLIVDDYVVIVEPGHGPAHRPVARLEARYRRIG